MVGQARSAKIIRNKKPQRRCRNDARQHDRSTGEEDEETTAAEAVMDPELLLLLLLSPVTAARWYTRIFRP